MESRSLAMVSRRLSFAFSIASSFTSTASILETMLPIECSIRSTRRLKLKEKKDSVEYLLDQFPFLGNWKRRKGVNSSMAATSLTAKQKKKDFIHSFIQTGLNHLHIEFLIRDSSSASTGASKSWARACTKPASGFPIVITIITSSETGSAFRACTLCLLGALHFLNFIIQFSLSKHRKRWINTISFLVQSKSNFFFLTTLLTITHVTYNKINNRKEMKYIYAKWYEPMSFYLLSFQVFLHLSLLLLVENSVAIQIILGKNCFNFSICMATPEDIKEKFTLIISIKL